jgi:hypothetical protein
MNFMKNMFMIFKHKHKWQSRAINRYGMTTYRVCLKCGRAECISHDEWKNGFLQTIYERCERMSEFDSEYD